MNEGRLSSGTSLIKGGMEPVQWDQPHQCNCLTRLTNGAKESNLTKEPSSATSLTY